MKKIIAAILTFALMLLCLTACAPSDKNGDDAEGVRSTIDDIPQTSTIPPYSKTTENLKYEDSARCFIFDYNEALDMYRKLKERGIDFFNDHSLFYYQNDEMFTVYRFSGSITNESYLTCEGKEFYELEFKKNKVDITILLFHKDRFRGRVGIGDYSDPFATVGYSRSGIVPKEIYENFCFSKLHLSPQGMTPTDYTQPIGYYRYYFVYEDELIAVIYSVNPLPDDFMEKIKDTFIILRREDS